MKDLSMHMMDIARNSVRAGAKVVEISLNFQSIDNSMELSISDDGCGMDQETVNKVTDPFVSTRITRKVGLGLPFLKMNAEQTGGSISIDSEPGRGTRVKAGFLRGHIDCIPLGDIPGTVALLICGTPDVDFIIHITQDEKRFNLNSKEVKDELGDVGVYNPEVVNFLREMVKENMEEMSIQ
ncbi:ATP-binding protein [Alkalitalea saponilacus]|nr:ATP-binding protein [Alkalitalea saponilacus]